MSDVSTIVNNGEGATLKTEVKNESSNGSFVIQPPSPSQVAADSPITKPDSPSTSAPNFVRCPICENEKITIPLRDHIIERHHNEFHCMECNEIFPVVEALRKHCLKQSSKQHMSRVKTVPMTHNTLAMILISFKNGQISHNYPSWKTIRFTNNFKPRPLRKPSTAVETPGTSFEKPEIEKKPAATYSEMPKLERMTPSPSFSGREENKLNDPLKIDVKNDIESEDDDPEQKTPKTDEKCVGCGKYHHDYDMEAYEEQLAAERKQKPLMSKKKSQKHQINNYRWICCDVCQSWYHNLCSGLEQFEYYLYEFFHCHKCVETAGPSIEYKNQAPHRLMWYKMEEKFVKEIEVGSQVWIEKLKEWESVKIPPATDNEVFVFDNGHDFNAAFYNNKSNRDWYKICLVKNIEGLGMRMPEKKDFDIENVVELMGADYEVDTIDVFNQNTYSMKLKTFLKLIRDPLPRKRLYNFLSLEFSDNEKMKEFVSPPLFVKDISLVDQLWSEEAMLEDHGRVFQADDVVNYENRPKVEEFCLAGMANSYTDFHIDFGGSSVYYHILRGKKIFYVAEPTEKNLKMFAHHEIHRSTHQWFGDRAQGIVKRVEINEGETLLIPAGWIHAVFTPVDSLVFGGNFLHAGNVEMQIKIYHLEKEVRKAIISDDKFYFPNFEFVHWQWTRNVLLEKLKEANDEGCDLSETDGITWRASKCLVVELRSWYERNKANKDGQSASDMLSQEKLISSFESNMKKQEKLQKDMKSPVKAVRKQKRDSPATDEEYEPSAVKKLRKKRAVASKVEENVPEEASRSIFRSNLNHWQKVANPRRSQNSQNTDTPSLKIQLGPPNEDKMNTANVFAEGRTSSGRKVKVTQSVKEYCGEQLDEEAIKTIENGEGSEEKKLKTFQELDQELIKCEAKEAGEKVPKMSPKKKIQKVSIPVEKKAPKPRKKNATVQQRLASKIRELAKNH